MLRMEATPCLLPAGGKAAGSVDLRAQVQSVRHGKGDTGAGLRQGAVPVSSVGFPPSRFPLVGTP